MRKMIVTPFSILFSLGLIASVAVAVVYLSRYNTGDKAMTGMLAVLIAFFFAILLLAERILLRTKLLSFEKICRLEGIFIIGLALAFIIAI